MALRTTITLTPEDVGVIETALAHTAATTHMPALKIACEHISAKIVGTKNKHLAYYEKCMESGTLQSFQGGIPNGLCNDYFIDQEILRLFLPTLQDYEKLEEQGLCGEYWASGLPVDTDLTIHSAFTPLRQTIVLFMAAINGEL
jgi:hypothetical protein